MFFIIIIRKYLILKRITVCSHCYFLVTAVLIGFSSIASNITEGVNAQICAQIKSGSIGISVSVSITTTTLGSAIGKKHRKTSNIYDDAAALILQICVMDLVCKLCLK